MREVIATTDPEQRILNGDVRECLRSLPDGSVQCCVTSPPYWGLRAYGTDPQVWGGEASCEHAWSSNGFHHKGGPQGAGGQRADRDVSAQNAAQSLAAGDTCCRCGAWRGELGSEPSPKQFIANMVEVFREVHRVLRPDGVLLVNIGDSYNAYNGGAGPGSKLSKTQSRERPQLESGFGLRYKGLKPKDLIGVPWMLAFALRDELGFTLRQDIIWHKKAPMPESVTDRCTKAHEYLFLLAKSDRYYFDAEAIKEKAIGGTPGNTTHRGATAYLNGDEHHRTKLGLTNVPAMEFRNKRSVWSLGTQPYKGAHFATFPVGLVMPCIQAGTSEHGCCEACGAPWRRITNRRRITRERPNDLTKRVGEDGTGNHCPNTVAGVAVETVGWEPTCKCGAGVVPCVVLDPFLGSGTSLQVARSLGRCGIGCELNPDYVELAIERINTPLKPPKVKKPKRKQMAWNQKPLF